MSARHDWSGIVACVTGAAGFVGTNLCHALVAAGAEVHGMVRKGSRRERLADLAGQCTVHTVDLRDLAAVQECLGMIRPSVIFHAAVHDAYSPQDPLPEVVMDDVLAPANLIWALRSLKPRPRLVYLASSTEYGPSNAPHGEEDSLRPTTQRGTTKAASTLLVIQQARAGFLDAVVLRLFSVYGPWEAECRLVPSAIRAALDGTVLPMTRCGLRRDYVFVEDVAEACLLAAMAPEAGSQVINIGSGSQTTNEALVETIGKVVGLPVRTEVGAYVPHVTDTECWVADVRRAGEVLGWTPRHELPEGLARTAAWVRQHRNAQR